MVGTHQGHVVNQARDEILARIRAANKSAQRSPGGEISSVVSGDALARQYRTAGDFPAGAEELIDLLEDRLLDYKAAVSRTDEAGVPAAIASALGAATAVVVPPGLPPEWAPAAVADDGSLSSADLDRFDAVVTGAAVAAADTGTIVLDASPDQGRRAISLIPDTHVCVLRADQVVQTVPEMLARLEPTRPLTLVSGPSATSDIELQRVEGVHGPRNLHIVLVL